MASIDVTEIGEFMIKHGAKAVMLVWLASQQVQINQITDDYKDCMNDRIIDSQRRNGNNRSVAILPKQIKVAKEWEKKRES